MKTPPICERGFRPYDPQLIPGRPTARQEAGDCAKNCHSDNDRGLLTFVAISIPKNQHPYPTRYHTPKDCGGNSFVLWN